MADEAESAAQAARRFAQENERLRAALQRVKRAAFVGRDGAAAWAQEGNCQQALRTAMQALTGVVEHANAVTASAPAAAREGER